MIRNHNKEDIKISPMRIIPAEEIAIDSSGYIFSQEIIDTLSELGSVFQKIHNRLISEGYSIIDDKLINAKGEVEYERPKRYKQEYHQRN